jgi:hypothetical protein
MRSKPATGRPRRARSRPRRIGTSWALVSNSSGQRHWAACHGGPPRCCNDKETPSVLAWCRKGEFNLNYTDRLGDELGGLGGLQALYQNRHNHLRPYGINCRRRKNVTRGHQFLKRVPLGSSGFGAHALEKRFDEVVSGPMNGVGIAPYDEIKFSGVDRLPRRCR